MTSLAVHSGRSRPVSSKRIVCGTRTKVEPDTINTIPGKAVFSVDFRHPDGETIDYLSRELGRLGETVARNRGVEITVERIWTSDPTPFDPAVVDAIRDGCRRLGLPHEELWSGAGHDAKHLADLVPLIEPSELIEAEILFCRGQFC